MEAHRVYGVMKYPDDFINKIILGDCLEVMKDIPNESVDFVITSPPYDKIRKYKGYFINLFDLGVEISRVLKFGGVCVLVIQDQTVDWSKTLTSFRTIVNWCDNTELNLFECCIYRRGGTPGAWWSKRFRVDHEYIPIFVKGNKPNNFDKSHMKIISKQFGEKKKGKERKTDGSFTKYEYNSSRYPRLKCSGTVLDYESSRASDKSLKLEHPAWFPSKLASDFILCFSKVEDLILDPMCGSGTSLLESKKNNRNFIGIDISEDYCKLSKERIGL